MATVTRTAFLAAALAFGLTAAFAQVTGVPGGGGGGTGPAGPPGTVQGTPVAKTANYTLQCSDGSGTLQPIQFNGSSLTVTISLVPSSCTTAPTIIVENHGSSNLNFTLTGVTVNGNSSLDYLPPMSTGGAFGYVLYCDATCANWSARQIGASTFHNCSISVGADNAAAALGNSDLSIGQQCFITQPATVIEITVRSDAGTPNVIPGRDRLGTVVNLLSGALATAASGAQGCSNTGGTTALDGTTTCSGTLQNTTLNAGDWINLVSGTAGGTAKRMSISVSYIAH